MNKRIICHRNPVLCVSILPAVDKSHVCYNETVCYIQTPLVVHKPCLLCTNPACCAQTSVRKPCLLYTNPACCTHTLLAIHKLCLLYTNPACTQTLPVHKPCMYTNPAYTRTLLAIHKLCLLYTNPACYTQTLPTVYKPYLTYTTLPVAFAVFPKLQGSLCQVDAINLSR